MTTYYEKRLATEFPKESGSYPTDKGVLDYNAENKSWSSTKGLNRTLTISEHPEWWLYPIPSPIQSMTLDEAKQQVSCKERFKDWSVVYALAKARLIEEDLTNQVAEIYLQHNTLSLKQEVEGLKESCVRLQDELFEMRENPNYADARVKTLTEAINSVCDLCLRYHKENGNSPAANHMRNDLIEALNGITKQKRYENRS